MRDDIQDAPAGCDDAVIFARCSGMKHHRVGTDLIKPLNFVAFDIALGIAARSENDIHEIAVVIFHLIVRQRAIEAGENQPQQIAFHGRENHFGFRVAKPDVIF